MKRLRVTATPDPDDAPAFFRRLALSPAIDEARLLDWNAARDGETTLLLAVDGDPEPVASADGSGEAGDAVDGITSVDVARGDDGEPSTVVVAAEAGAAALFDCIATASARGGLVVRTPVVYRDGTIEARVVGDPAVLQEAFDETGGIGRVRVDEVGPLRANPEGADAALSPRQREALAAALEVGYYERPREATHDDVARVLDCAPTTASDHLQKAEAKVVRAALDAFGPA